MEKEILTKLYDTTKERSTSEEYDNLRRKLSAEKEKFLQEIGEEKETKLEELTDIIYEMESILGKEDFCNGFSMAVRLFIECTYKEGDDQ